MSSQTDQNDVKDNGQTNLTQEAYNDIRRMIFSNDMKPGQKIPYRRMAEGLNMSLTPVVQALKHMEFMGLVHHVQNRGFFIENVTPEEIDEAYELRMVLEPLMLKVAIPKLDKSGEQNLENALNEYLDVCKSGSLKLKLVKDIYFHMTIAELSGQRLSIMILRHLFDFLYLRFGQQLIFSRPHEDAAEQHISIFEAIRDRDVDRASQLIEKHIKFIQRNAMEGIQERLSVADEIVF